MANDLIEIGINVRSNADEATRGLTRLESEIVKQLRTVDRLEKGYKDLDRAMNSGKITAQTYAKGIQQVDAAIEAVWDSSKRASTNINTMSNSFSRATNASKKFENTSRKGMRRVEVIAQQAGYQIGDLAVQIQGGTNAAVALGQQGSQLLGFFGPAGALAGAALAIGTGLIAPLLRGEEAAADLTDRIKELREEIAEIKGSQILPSEQVAVLKQQGDALEALAQKQKELATIQEKITDLEAQRMTTSLLYQSQVSEELVVKGDIVKLQEKLEALGQNNLDYQTELVNKGKALAEVEEASLKREISLGLLKIQFGEDSVAAKNLEREQTLRIYEEELKRLNIHPEIIKGLVAQKSTALGVADNLAEATDEARLLAQAADMAASALARMSGFSAGIESKIRVARAELDALNSGQDRRIASETELLRVENERLINQEGLTGEALEAANLQYNKNLELIDTYGEIQKNIKGVESAQRSSGRAATRASKDTEKAVRTVNDVFKDAIVTAEEFELQMAEGVVGAVDSVANAWGDFVMRGFQDFKGFVDSVWSSFKSLISNMIATAAKNKILISLGLGGGTAAGTVAGAAQSVLGGGGAGSILSSVGSIAGIGSSFIGGVTNVIGATLSSGISAGFSSISAQVATAAATGTATSIAAAIGSIAVPIAVFAAAVSFFKKSTEQLDSGIRLMSEAGGVQSFEFTKDKESQFFGLSTSISHDYDGASSEVSRAMDNTFKTITNGLQNAASQLGLARDQFTELWEGWNYNIYLEGLSDAEAQAEINRVFGMIADDITKYGLQKIASGTNESLQQVVAQQKDGEALADTFIRLGQSLTLVNGAVGLLGGTTLDISLSSGAAAASLAELSGGLEAFVAKSDYLFQNFLTLEEQQTRLANAAMGVLVPAFEALNTALPETHAEFMALVNAQDLNTEAGRQFHTALLDVADEFITVKGTAEEAIAGIEGLTEAERERQSLLLQIARLEGDTAYIRQQEILAVSKGNQDLVRRIHLLEDEAEAARLAERNAEATFRAIEEAAKVALSVAQDSLQLAETGVDTAFDRLQVAIDSVVQRLETSLEAANERVDTSRRIFDLLAGTVRDRRFGATQLSETNFSRARQSALGFLRSGDVADEQKLEDALRVVSEPSEGLFGSFTDYARDFFKTSSTIEALEKTAGVQLNADEQAVIALEEQISQAESQMDILQEQYNTLLGIETAVLSIPQAIANLQGAFSNLTVAQAAVETAQTAVSVAGEVAGGTSNVLGPVEALYKSMLGRDPDAAGLDFWRGTGLAGKELVDAFRVGAIGQGEVPQFANGGYHTGGVRMVGEQGPELEVTGPSRIYSNKQTSAMFHDPDLKDAVRGLREEVAGLRTETVQLQASNNKFVKRSYDLYRKWDIDGQPPERT